MSLDKSNFVDNFYSLPIVPLIKRRLSISVLKKQLKTLAEKNAFYSIDDMDGYEFEECLEKLLVKMGYDVERTELSGD